MPEELIFFALIIIFSVLDGLLRKKKPGQVELPEDWEPPEGWEDDPAPTLEAPRTSTRRRPDPAPAGVPGEVWEEIARLARGERAEPVELDGPVGEEVEDRDVERRHASSLPTPSETLTRGEVGTKLPAPIGRKEVGTRADLFEHPVHASHALYGTDPSERPENVATIRRERLSPDVAAVRSMLSGDRRQLRRAVILQEMLGPPVSLRDPAGPGDPGGL